MPINTTRELKFLKTADNKKISYEHYKNSHQEVIVIAHGFYNSKDAILLKKLADNLLDDYDVFMFDFRGHGKSSGLYSWTSKEEKDLEVVLTHLRPEYKKIGIIAFSLGASVCINFLARNEMVNSLICVSGPCEFNKIDYKFWKLDLKEDLLYTLFSKEGRTGRGFRAGPFWLKKKKPIENVDKLTIPILYIHGEKDWVIKPWHSKALFEKTTAKKKLVIIKNGTHAEYLMKGTSKEFINQIKDWFFNTLN
ncbi:MAG: alpha/beta hydrolase [Candidatus Omnitrophota bacterium]